MNSFHDSPGGLEPVESCNGAERAARDASRLPVIWRRPPLWQMLPAELAGNEWPQEVHEAEANNVILANHFRDDLSLEMDSGFHEQLARVRVQKAKELLLNSNYCMVEIAAELGFDSLGQFYRAFKRTVGEPPHDYRARFQTEN
jgi:methylphosphotriester-DNA--protein-cysteine methyltransferase